MWCHRNTTKKPQQKKKKGAVKNKAIFCRVTRRFLESSLDISGSDVEKMERPPVIDFTVRLPPFLWRFFPSDVEPF